LEQLLGDVLDLLIAEISGSTGKSSRSADPAFLAKMKIPSDSLRNNSEPVESY
jgi:hypothetical protein